MTNDLKNHFAREYNHRTRINGRYGLWAKSTLVIQNVNNKMLLFSAINQNYSDAAAVLFLSPSGSEMGKNDVGAE
jgi:hypothetical protein